MKLLVETSGKFQLFVPGDGQFAHANRPSVVVPSHFFDQHVARGRLKLLHQLKDEATDAEFFAHLKESKGNVELAVAAFLSTYSLDAVPAPASEPTQDAKPAKTPKTPSPDAAESQ